MSLKSKNNEYDSVILPNKILGLLDEELIKNIGEEKTYKINYEEGHKIGKSLISKYIFDYSREKLIKLLKKFLKIGYYSGVIEEIFTIKQKENELIIKLKTKNPLRNIKLKKPFCGFILGEIVGFLEGLTGKKWIGKETKCISLGDKFDEMIFEEI